MLRRVDRTKLKRYFDVSLFDSTVITTSLVVADAKQSIASCTRTVMKSLNLSLLVLTKEHASMQNYVPLWHIILGYEQCVSTSSRAHSISMDEIPFLRRADWKLIPITYADTLRRDRSPSLITLARETLQVKLLIRYECYVRTENNSDEWGSVAYLAIFGILVKLNCEDRCRPETQTISGTKQQSMLEKMSENSFVTELLFLGRTIHPWHINKHPAALFRTKDSILVSDSFSHFSLGSAAYFKHFQSSSYSCKKSHSKSIHLMQLGVVLWIWICDLDWKIFFSTTAWENDQNGLLLSNPFRSKETFRSRSTSSISEVVFKQW